MRWYIPIFVALALTVGGCAQLQKGVTVLSSANDGLLEASEMGVCRGASVGSVVRRYWSDPSRAKAWGDLCYPVITPPVIGGPNPVVP